MNDKLKPCPFCGGKAQRWYKWGRAYRGYAYWVWVECNICKCRTSGTAIYGWEDADDDEMIEIFNTSKAIREAAVWNSRMEEA